MLAYSVCSSLCLPCLAAQLCWTTHNKKVFFLAQHRFTKWHTLLLAPGFNYTDMLSCGLPTMKHLYAAGQPYLTQIWEHHKAGLLHTRNDKYIQKTQNTLRLVGKA